MNNLQEARAKKHLSSVIRWNNRTVCIDTWLIDMKEHGYKPEVNQVPAVQFNRTKYNRMTGYEQEQYEKRMNEKKTEYCIRGEDGRSYVINKIEYDFMISLFNKTL